jgi:ubiquitin-like modifier-activating enzyme ATG7
VVGEYKKKGFSFLLEVFNNPTYLEDVTGLTKMKEESSAIQWQVAADGDDF